MSTGSDSIRDRIASEDVTVARSYLEVDVMEWLSDNEIPFGYEPFVIPSVAGPGKEQWETMVDALQMIGDRDFEGYDETVAGTMWDDTRPAEIMAMWEDIYDKHRLQDEVITVEVRDSLRNYSKTMILPDFVLYPDAGMTIAPDDFDWSDWDAIVEVSGLWGVGLPGESTRSDWWDWYRVGGVAFKELAYKLLGLWDDTYWVIPNQPYIEGVSDGIPKAIRNDSHYVIINTTSATLELEGLADAVGITADAVDSGLSPVIQPTSYERPRQNDPGDELQTIQWQYDGILMDATNADANTVPVTEDMLVYHGEIGDVYISNESVHIRESQWRKLNMLVVREYVADVLSILDDAGIVQNLRRVSGE